MNRTKRIVTIAIFLLGTLTFYGQNKFDKDKIKALKVAYITEHLDLTSKEAEIFWPIGKRNGAKYEEKCGTWTVFRKRRPVTCLPPTSI
mgnify:CR=1 FL=1